jgi:hypothetical protein
MPNLAPQISLSKRLTHNIVAGNPKNLISLGMSVLAPLFSTEWNSYSATSSHQQPCCTLLNVYLKRGNHSAVHDWAILHVLWMSTWLHFQLHRVKGEAHDVVRIHN